MSRIKTKILFCSILVISLVSFLFFRKAPLIPQELISLNSKYNLVEISSLDYQSDQKVPSFLNSNDLQTNTFIEDKPTKELIIKLEGGNENLENILLLKLQSETDIESISQDYENLEIVAYAEPDYEITLDSEETTASEITTERDQKTSPKNSRSKNIIVAVIDSGVDLKHPDFKNRLVEGWDFLNDQKKVIDDIGHGTHIAGIITKNSENTLIMPLKFTDQKNGKMSAAIKSIKYAVDHDAKVLNLSFGFEKESRTLKEAIDYALEKDVIVIAASGNKNSESKYYPAAWKNVISVAATNRKDQKAYISNYGKWVKFSALGERVYSAEPNKKHGFRTGTSQAAPLVSAKVAEILVRLEDSEQTLENILDELQELGKNPRGKYAKKLGKVIK